MSKEERNIIEYIVCCISEFAKQHNIAIHQAYQYLHDFKGLKFLDEQYEIEHTFSIDDAVADLTLICNRNGGNLK